MRWADSAGRPRTATPLDVVARIGLVAYGVVHLLLGWLSVQLALGHTDKNASTTGAMHELARQPFGTELVWAVAFSRCPKAASTPRQRTSRSMPTEALMGNSGAAYLVLGQVGYVAKGVATGLVGALFVHAGIDHDSSESGGLDQALQKVLQAPGGPMLIVVIGVGFACYGLFCFARSRHLDR